MGSFWCISTLALEMQTSSNAVNSMPSLPSRPNDECKDEVVRYGADNVCEIEVDCNREGVLEVRHLRYRSISSQRSAIPTQTSSFRLRTLCPPGHSPNKSLRQPARACPDPYIYASGCELRLKKSRSLPLLVTPCHAFGPSTLVSEAFYH